jgi:hypothetical protein
MVSSLLVDALRDPSGAIADLYTPVTNGDFAAVVTKHFSEVFQTRTAFDQASRVPLYTIYDASVAYTAPQDSRA